MGALVFIAAIAAAVYFKGSAAKPPPTVAADPAGREAPMPSDGLSKPSQVQSQAGTVYEAATYGCGGNACEPTSPKDEGGAFLPPSPSTPGPSPTSPPATQPAGLGPSVAQTKEMQVFDRGLKDGGTGKEASTGTVRRVFTPALSTQVQTDIIRRQGSVTGGSGIVII